MEMRIRKSSNPGTHHSEKMTKYRTRKEKRKRGKYVSIEEGKEREKRRWENRKGEGNFGRGNLSQQGYVRVTTF
jgi:hypothetical protein